MRFGGHIMNMIRMNITIPEDLARQLDHLVGQRKKSSFIAEALHERIKKIEQEELHKMLEEGYKDRKRESLSIAKDFEPADLEGWDEY
jgi:metal-responsive CopG/Arc/MetJ family transcriptional regulator